MSCLLHLLVIKMKCFIIILLIIVLIRTEVVRSHGKSNEDVQHSSLPDASTMKNTAVNEPDVIRLPKYVVYLMGFIIGLLFLIVLILLAIIYRRKRIHRESIDDNIKITETHNLPKYKRQLSSETSDTTRENINDDNKYKLTRQESKMTIADYPTSYMNNEKKPLEPHATTPNVSKVLNPQLGQMQKEQIKLICQGVLQKTQHLNEANSLSSLDTILNENVKPKESENPGIIDKSASSPFLDVAENFKALPSPLPAKKLEEFSDSNLKSCDNANDQQESKYLPFRLPPIRNNKNSDVLIKEDINDNPLQSTRHVLPNDSNDEQDDVYDNPPRINRPFLHSNTDNEQLEDVYDNPPSNRPVLHANTHNKHVDDVYDNSLNRNGPVSHINADNEHLDDVYDNPPNINRPVLRMNSDNEHIDDVYDNPPSNRPLTNLLTYNDDFYDELQCNKIGHHKGLTSSTTQKSKTESEKDGLNDYDNPQAGRRGILVDDDNDSGYLLAITDEKEPCFDQCYINAKALNKNYN